MTSTKVTKRKKAFTLGAKAALEIAEENTELRTNKSLRIMNSVADCADTTELPLSNTIKCMLSNVVDAQSVTFINPKLFESSLSIMTIKQVKLDNSSAVDAIRASVTFTTMKVASCLR